MSVVSFILMPDDYCSYSSKRFVVILINLLIQCNLKIVSVVVNGSKRSNINVMSMKLQTTLRQHFVTIIIINVPCANCRVNKIA